MDTRQQIDWLTVIAIAVIAYAAVNITHEIVGHCGMALLTGTKCAVISSTYIPLAEPPPGGKFRIIVAAGCAANFVVGLMCLVSLRRKAEIRSQVAGGTKTTQSTLSYFLWLWMSVNLFLASTYIAIAPIIKFGDSYILIQDLRPQLFWRPAVALAGAIAWWFSFRASRVELARLIGGAGQQGRAIAWRLIVPAYLAGGIVTVASALFSGLDWRIAQLEAAGGTLGLTVWLLALPLFIPQSNTFARAPLVIGRSIAWIVAGALTAVIFIGLLGRGVAL